MAKLGVAAVIDDSAAVEHHDLVDPAEPSRWRLMSRTERPILFFGLGEGGGEDALPYTWADLIAATVLWQDIRICGGL